MNGYDVARTLREELDFTGSIAAITGWGTRNDCARSKAAGIDASNAELRRVASS